MAPAEEELKRTGSPEERRQNSVSDFPPPAGRELILRSTVPRPAPYSRALPQRMYSVLTREDFRLAGAFSSDTSFFWVFWSDPICGFRDSADPLCGREVLPDRTPEAMKRSCPVEWSRIIPASEGLWGAKLGSCCTLVGAEGMGLSCWKISAPKRWPLCGEVGDTKKQQELSVLTVAGLGSFILFCDYPLGYCLAFIVCINTCYIY